MIQVLAQRQWSFLFSFLKITFVLGLMVEACTNLADPVWFQWFAVNQFPAPVLPSQLAVNIIVAEVSSVPFLTRPPAGFNFAHGQCQKT